MARRLSVVALVTAMIAASAGPVLGADSTIDTVKGGKYKMADAVIADRVTRFTDAAADQAHTDGTSAIEAPRWSDLSRVHVATAKTPAKLRTKMQEKHPPGAADAFYGSAAKPRVDRPIIFVAVEMARKLPPNAKGQLVEVGLAGVDATPVQVGAALDPRIGVELFSLSGLFTNGALATGDTNVVGKEPGAELADADYYNAESGVYGFYRPNKATWYLAIPRAGATGITVSVQSTTDDGQLIDRLELPGGGHFIDLGRPTGGYKKNAGPALTCRALETFSGDGGVVELSDVDATLIRYTAGVDLSVGQKKRVELLSQAIEAAGPVEVLLSPVGTEETPTMVAGELSTTPERNAVQLSFEAPAGQWTFALAEELRTAAGELVIDAFSLTGPAGVRTGAGLDGLAAGDLSCLDPALDDEPAQAAADAEGSEAAQDAAPEDAAPEEGSAAPE